MADQDLQTILRERFAQLPAPVQKAIFSEDISKNLRQLSDARKLHLDQWQKLENVVMMALFGITPIDELQRKIQEELGVSTETAAELLADISRIIFEPIRQELERELEHPEAKAKEMSDVETARGQALREAAPADSGQPPPPPPVQPGTPPPSPPTEKAIRMPASGAYKPGEASASRKDVHDDPYRESPQ